MQSAHERIEVTPEVLLNNVLNPISESAIGKFTWSSDSAGIVVEVNSPPEFGKPNPGQGVQAPFQYVGIESGERRPIKSGQRPETSRDGRISAYFKGGYWPDLDSVMVVKASGEPVCNITGRSLDPMATGINAMSLYANGDRIAVAIGVKPDGVKRRSSLLTPLLKKNGTRDSGFSENQAEGKQRPTVEVYTEEMTGSNDDAYERTTVVWSLDTKCGDKQRLAEIPRSYIGQLKWTQGGNQLIATVHQPVPGLTHGRTDLVSIDAQGGPWRVFKRNIGGQAAPRDFLAVSPDGDHVAFAYDDDGQPSSGRFQVAIVSSKDGIIRRVSADLRDGVQWMDNMNLWLVALAPHDSLSRAATLSITGEEIFVADLPGSARPSPDLRKVAWVQSDHYGASTLWVADLRRIDNTWDVANRRRLLDMPAPLAGFARGERRLLACKSDGLNIAGMLVLPLNYEQGQSYPLIVDIHGGPTGGFSGIYYSYPPGTILKTTTLEYDLWAAKGYAVLSPDYRASGLYGFDKIARDGTGLANDFKDIMCNVDQLIAEGVVDGERMAVIGHSAGGAETNWVVTHSNRFRAAITYEGGHGDAFFGWAAGGKVNMSLDIQLGSALDHPEHYRRMSVLEAVKGVTTPTMFVSSQGGEVKVDVYDWMFAAWRYQGIEAQYRIYHDEGHALRKPANQRDFLFAAIEWIDGHMEP